MADLFEGEIEQAFKSDPWHAEAQHVRRFEVVLIGRHPAGPADEDRAQVINAADRRGWIVHGRR